MDGWMDGWTDGGREGRRDGGTEGWRDGRMARQTDKKQTDRLDSYIDRSDR